MDLYDYVTTPPHLRTREMVIDYCTQEIDNFVMPEKGDKYRWPPELAAEDLRFLKSMRKNLERHTDWNLLQAEYQAMLEEVVYKAVAHQESTGQPLSEEWQAFAQHVENGDIVHPEDIRAVRLCVETCGIQAAYQRLPTLLTSFKPRDPNFTYHPPSPPTEQERLQALMQTVNKQAAMRQQFPDEEWQTLEKMINTGTINEEVATASMTYADTIHQEHPKNWLQKIQERLPAFVGRLLQNILGLQHAHEGA